MLSESAQAAWDELIELDAQARALQTSFDILDDRIAARRQWATVVLICLAVVLVGLVFLLFSLRWLPYRTWEPLFSVMLVVGFGLAGIAEARNQLAACTVQLRTAQRDLRPDLNDARDLIADYVEESATRPSDQTPPRFSL